MYFLITIFKKYFSTSVRTLAVRVLLATFILFVTGQKLFGNDSDASKANELIRNISKGGNVAIDLASICKNTDSDCDVKTIVIHSSPNEGAVIERRDGLYLYQHGGVSSADDIFRVVYDTEAGSGGGGFDVRIKIGAPTAYIETLESSNASSSIDGDSFEISYKIEGTGYDHVHFSLNGGEHVSLYPVSGKYTFENLRIGKNIISGVLAKADHTIIPSSYVEIEVNRIR